MKKNFAKRMVAAAILTSWLATPGFVLAGERVEITGNTPVTQPGISDSHYSGNFGGAVYNEGTDTTLSGEFSNNSAHVSGGALQNWENAAVTISNGTSFVNNEIITQEIQQSFGGAIDNQGKMTFEDGTSSSHISFSGNKASTGGAIYNYATGIPTYIGNYTSFDNNNATRTYGGAIYTRSGIEIGDNVSFTNNTATWGGGAIGSEMVKTASMPEPSVTTLTIGKNALFQNNIADWTKTAWAMGGAIINTNGTINIDDGAQFISNKAANGGAIANKQDDSAGAESVINLGKSYFKSNAAMNGYGGAIFNAKTVTVGIGSAFSQNTSTKDGGAIYNAGTLTVNGDVSQEYNTNFDGNHSDGNGGAIFNAGIAEIEDGVSFTNNSSNGNGGAIYADKGSTTTIGNNVQFSGNYTNNQYGYGGAIYINDAIVNIGDNALFSDNRSTSTDEWGGAGGGAIAKWGLKTAAIGKNAQFIHNGYEADGTTAGARNGGAIYHSGATGAWIYDPATGEENLTVTGAGGKLVIGENSVFSNNISTTRGGAIYNENGIVEIGQASAFANNSSDKGGAIYNVKTYEDTSVITVDTKVTVDKGAQFVNNSAASLGGAIYNYGGEVVINGGEVVSGKDTYKTIFSGNTAGILGGAVYNAGKVTLNTADGDIIFENNKAAGALNDIFMDKNSSLDLSGSNTVSIGSGIASAIADTTDSNGLLRTNTNINNNGASLVLESGSKNADFKGYYNQNSGSVTVNSEFFGGTSNILSGDVNLNNGADIVADSNVVMSTGTNIYINNDPDKIGKVIINGEVDSFSNGAGAITLAGGELVINGDQSGFTGQFTQDGGIDTSTTITADGTFFGGTNEINSGKLVVKEGASLSNDIVIKDYSVALDLDGRELLLSDGGIVIEGNNQAAGAHSITGSLNLENTEVKVDETTGIQSDVYVANGSTITNTDGTKDVTVGGNGHDVTLSLGSGAITSEDQTLNVSDNSTINLTPMGSLNLHAEITGGADAKILVDGTELKAGEGKYDVGTVLLNADNSGFVGSYTQNDGTVIVNEGSTFFGGTNNVNTNEMDGSSGSLILNDGALLASDVNINGNATTDVSGLANVTFRGSTGEITQENITSGEFNYAATETASGDGVNVNNAGVIFSNNTIISDLDTTQNALVVSTNNDTDKGVRMLGFAEGSGVKGDILLNHGTGLAYFDGAYIENDSSLVMAGADLIFANDKTNINYNPEIIGEGTITKGGMGTTTIQSSLNEEIDIVAQSGALNLVSADTQTLGDIAVGDVGEIDPDETTAIVNIAGTKSDLTIGDIEVAGKNAVLNIIGNATAGDTVVNKGTLGVFGQSSLSSLSLGSTLDMLGNNQINNLNIAGDFTLTDNSNFRFDVDPRSKTTDTINASGSLINTNTDPTGDPYTMLITGINFTQSPIDRQVNFDINNILTAGGIAQNDVVKLQDGGIIANSQMGKYLITSSGASNMLSASLIDLNPQMYRGQVATVASYANQLVVNNILFDHMNILANDLIARDTNANRYAAANPLFAPYQYSKKDGDLWYKAYGNFERISMTQGLNVGNNAYGSLIGADFPLISLKNGWSLVPTAYIGYNGGHQTFDGVSMYQNGAQVGAMATAYKDNWITSLLAYGGGYANDMSVHGPLGGGSDTTGNWFAGVASKTAYNYHLPHDLILQPTALVSYNIFGNQNYHSNFGNMSMNSGFLNGINVAPGVNLIWNKKTFSLYATAQLVFNIMGDVSGKAGNIDLNDVRMRTTYFEYGIGAMKKFKDRFTGYLQITLRNGYRTGIGFQGGLQWKIGK